MVSDFSIGNKSKIDIFGGHGIFGGIGMSEAS